MRPNSRTSSRCSLRSVIRSSRCSNSSSLCQTFLRSLMNRSLGMRRLPIANCRFPIGDFRFRIQPATMASDQSAMLIECVPNFSEGRKVETVDRIARAIESVENTFVLSRHMDMDHNRSVITFVAPPEVIIEAAVRAVATAAELIDLREHAGVHPRIGATDVLPFVPVSGATMDDCVAIAHQTGQRIWQELSIPVYFYER